MRSMYGVFSKRRTFVRWPSGYDNTVAPFSRPPATQKVKASRVVFSGAVAHCLILYCICQMSLFSLVVVSCSATLISLVLYLALAACFETPSNSEDQYYLGYPHETCTRYALLLLTRIEYSIRAHYENGRYFHFSFSFELFVGSGLNIQLDASVGRSATLSKYAAIRLLCQSKNDGTKPSIPAMYKQKKSNFAPLQGSFVSFGNL